MGTQNQSGSENGLRTVEDIINNIHEKIADGDYISRGESQCHEIEQESKEKEEDNTDEISEIKAQMEQLQARLNQLSKN